MSAINRPIVSLSVHLKDPLDETKLINALSELTRVDNTFLFNSDSVGEIQLSGMDETHLQQISDRIRVENQLDLEKGEAQVIYRETIRQAADGDGKYIRNTGGSGNYGHVVIRLEPMPEGSGFGFVNEIRSGAVPQAFIQPVEQGIREALQGGVLAGYELVDLKATLFDGSYHEQDSNEIAFQIAASIALKKVARNASPVVLEPIMALEAVVSPAHMASVISDLNSLGGRIENIEQRNILLAIRAVVPLANLLQSKEHRRPEYSPRFLRYEPRYQNRWPGAEESGVTARKPDLPRTGRHSAAARFETEYE